MPPTNNHFKEVDRTANISELDVGVKNKFRWEWLSEKDSNGLFYSGYIRNIEKPGYAKCVWCDKLLSYRVAGKRSFLDHSKTNVHHKKMNMIAQNQCLPSIFTAHKSAIEGTFDKNEEGNQSEGSSQQGGIPNIPTSKHSSKQPDMRPTVNILDRKAYAEARTLAFAAEHNLPLSLVPHLLEYAKEMAMDPKALNFNMTRTTASYKMRDGLGNLLHKRLICDMRKYTFSLNVDECMSAAHEKVFSVLVSYFSDEDKGTVVKHYMSIAMQVVNAESLFEIIIAQLKKDSIPLTNLISILSDSANYMRGKISGFQTRMKKEAPHLLDIDGDICHHVHRTVKKLCLVFSSHVEHLVDDLHTDFKWSPDLRGKLEEICSILGINCRCPPNRCAQRWLSTLDVTLPNYHMMDAFIVFYFSFLKGDDKSNYKEYVATILSCLTQESKEEIKRIQTYLSSKNMTKEGKERKERIINKVFYKRDYTLLVMGFYIDLLPIFKSFILTFEQREPLMHRLHDDLKELTTRFLSGFVKAEKLKDKSARELSEIDVEDKNNLMKSSELYIGRKAEVHMSKLSKNAHARQEFMDKVALAYKTCGKYMLQTFPLKSNMLRCLSAIDPKAQGHTTTFQRLKKLGENFPTVLSPEEQHDYKEECRALQVARSPNLPPLHEDGHFKRADQWWGEIEKTEKYPRLMKVIKACLSIFTGPQIEQAFSQMNQIITPTSNRLDVQTFAAIISIKYHLRAKKMTALSWFHRKDVHKDKIDKGIPLAMHSAYSIYKEQIRDIQKANEAKRKALKIGELPRPRKTNYHQMAREIGIKIGLKRKRLVPKLSFNKKRKH